MIRLFHRPVRPSDCYTSTAGFTLVESLIAVALIGILVALATPSMLGFLNQRKINITRDMVYQALRATQADAMQHRQERRFSIRQRNGKLEWASHADSLVANQVTAWQPLAQGVVFTDIDNTFLKSGDVYYAKFDMHGNVQGRLGTITVSSAGGQHTHRCVVVSTLIGAMRKGEAQPQANGNNRLCY